jgi:pimeloyl-ACP methyl ester carboxylesterase
MNNKLLVIDFILYAQHGWADTCQTILTLAQALANPKTLIIAPDLGYIKTWIRIEPLIEKVEKNALQTIANYPHTPIRIIAHSMGGLIWLEILNRHPEWYSKIHSLVLIASPVGGADIARIFDPLGWGIGIAKDLGINRREIAEKIAQEIPTLVISGDIDNGSDGTIPIESTKFFNSQFVCVPGVSHPQLRNHSKVREIIKDFWDNPIITLLTETDLSILLIQRLRSVAGMTDAHRRYIHHSEVFLKFKNGISIQIWKNPLQVEHIFVLNHQGECLYAGFVGWIHRGDLHQALEDIRQNYHDFLSK